MLTKVDASSESGAVRYLCEMIRIPSQSGKEEAIAGYLQDEMVKNGIQAEKVEVAEHRYYVKAEIEGKHPGPRLLIAGHMDTVPHCDGWITDPYEPYRDDDKIYGLGACDMKAGLAVALSLAKYLNNGKDKMHGKVIFAFVPDEEVHSIGVKKLIQDGIKADFGFMLEPHFEKAITGAPGKLLLRLKVKGTSAHAAKAYLGINAVTECSRILSALDSVPVGYDDFFRPQPYIPLKVEGGYKEYSITVPEYCKAMVNKQLVPGEDREQVLENLNSYISSLRLKAKVDIDILPPYYPPYRIGEPDQYLLILKEAFEAVTSGALETGCGTSVSDANCLTGEGGIPTICFGPAGGNLHSANEWVWVNQINKAIDVYLLALSRILKFAL